MRSCLGCSADAAVLWCTHYQHLSGSGRQCAYRCHVAGAGVPCTRNRACAYKHAQPAMAGCALVVVDDRYTLCGTTTGWVVQHQPGCAAGHPCMVLTGVRLTGWCSNAGVECGTVRGYSVKTGCCCCSPQAAVSSWAMCHSRVLTSQRNVRNMYGPSPWCCSIYSGSVSCVTSRAGGTRQLATALAGSVA
jgi:hypothetical protein